MLNICGVCCQGKHKECPGSIKIINDTVSCDCNCHDRKILMSSKFLVLAFAGCLNTNASIRAIDTSACVASDILPGIPDTIKTLTDKTNPDVALKVITGIVTVGGAVAKGYACYLRSAALQTKVGGYGESDNNKTYVPPINIISGKAASCELMENKCDHELKSAWILFYLNKSGQVKL